MIEEEDEIRAILGDSCGIMKNRRRSKDRTMSKATIPISKCIICMGIKETQIVTACGHYFCSGCFEYWCQSCDAPRKCPVCREHVSLEEILLNGKSHEFNIKKNSAFAKYTKPVRIVEAGARNSNLRRFGATSFYSSNVDQTSPRSLTVVCVLLCFLFGILFYRYK
ncbi:hypothetical protein NGRA_1340 [Nosema granulosis]|uniref:RING-type domain-containing protein n=1 Tax=Nosema granulosis TaxID=83296 RepID=A0A9P6GZ51_9MICR|nr:hypothetical protein NGRA_1340 [Nosema granulosis]